MKLIVLPFAGGNKYSFSLLKKKMAMYEMITLEYSGRGTRSDEPLSNDIDLVVDDVYSQIIKCVEPDEDYVIYGHSMGGLLAYLVGVKIQDSNFTAPRCIIVSGRYSPAVCKNTNIHLLPSSAFWREIIALEGTPQGIANEPQIQSFFEPVLRNDFKMVETYISEDLTILNFPIYVLYGKNEAIHNLQDFYRWKELSSEKVSFYEFEGGHFFIINKLNEVANLLLSILKYEKAVTGIKN